MESSDSQQQISLTKKRKRGRPRKDEVVGSSNISPQVSLPEKRPIGRPRKDGCLGPSKTKSPPILVQQKRPVGRPRKEQINPLSGNEKIGTAKFCTLLPRLPNQYPSLSNYSLIHAPSSSQLIRGTGHSYDNNRNVVTGTSKHAEASFVNLSSSFDDVSNPELHEFDEEDIFGGDNGEDFNNGEDAVDNDVIIAHRVFLL